MSIPANTTGKVQYTGDGTTKTFPLNFPIFKTTAGVYAIRVSLADSSGENVSVLTENTDYTVNESGNSFCDVVLNTAPAAGKIITIIYDNELSQLYAPTDFTNLPAASLINAFDKLTAICIQMSEELNRCVKESVESPVDPQVVIEKVNALYTHLATLTALAGDLTKIDAVYADLEKVVIAANDISNINIAAADKDAIDALAAVTAAVSAVAESISAVNTAAANITAIQDAPAQAGNAAASATLAEKWAIQMDSPVSGSDYSAKKYALDAQEAAVQAGYSIDPLFTERDFTDDAPPSNLSWVRTDQMEAMFDGNLYEAAFNELKDGEPVATEHNGIKLLTGYGVTITDGQIYSGISVTPVAGVISGKIEVPNFSWTGVRETVEAALDNDDFSFFAYSKAFGLQIANYSNITSNTWYQLWDDGFIGLDVKWNGTNLIFRPRVYQSGEGWKTGNEATITPVPYFLNCQVTLRADSNTDPFRLIFYNPDQNVSSSYNTELANWQVKNGLNVYDTTYSVKAITYYPIAGTNVNYSINASDAQLLQCYSKTPSTYSVQEFKSYNSQWTSYDYTGTDTYTIGSSTYTINYKLYDRKKFIRNDPTYLQVKLIFKAFGKQPYYCVDNANKKFMLPCQQADHGIITICDNLIGTASAETAKLNIYEDGYFEVVGKVSSGKSLTFKQDVGDIYSLMASAGTISYSSKTLTLSAACSFFVTGGIGDNGKLKRTKHHYTLVGMRQDGRDIDVDYLEGQIQDKINQMSASIPFFFGQYMYSEKIPYKAAWLLADGEYKPKQAYPDMWNQLQLELDSDYSEGESELIDGKLYVKRGLSVVTTADNITAYDFVVNTSAQTFRVPTKVKGKQAGTYDKDTWYLLFYVGNMVENIERIAVDVIAGGIPFKANRDLDNLTVTGKAFIADCAAPSKRSSSFTSGNATQADGFIYYGGTSASSGGPHKYKIEVLDPDNSNALLYQETTQVGNGDDFGLLVHVPAGVKVNATCNTTPASSMLKFIYPKGIPSSNALVPVAWWDEQHYGDRSTKNLKAWSVYPYSWDSTVKYAFTDAAVPQVGDTVWLVGTIDGTTATQVSVITALGKNIYNSRAIQIAGTTAIYYERSSLYDRDEAFIS
ncbi:MAG: hypothetical protein IJ752_06185 [Alphaproteobacteria bacterium]|nr:hypothetical protein [Alphaproteobacteria bacterium]